MKNNIINLQEKLHTLLQAEREGLCAGHCS